MVFLLLSDRAYLSPSHHKMMQELYHRKDDLSMATEVYLAMRSEEFAVFEHPFAKPGWLDCHFSSDGSGLTGLPSILPPESLLIVTDRFPFRNHDPDLITEQLHRTITILDCAVVLLDFEKPKQKELFHLAQKLVVSLPCPVAVSEPYAREIDCPVFLSPCPHHIPLSEHIAPWTGRKIWLDLARNAEAIEITSSGTVVSSDSQRDIQYNEHLDENLHCHYHIEMTENSVRFMMRRTKEDMIALLHQSENLGIQTCIGLYQEWK